MYSCIIVRRPWYGYSVVRATKCTDNTGQQIYEFHEVCITLDILYTIDYADSECEVHITPSCYSFIILNV